MKKEWARQTSIKKALNKERRKLYGRFKAKHNASGPVKVYTLEEIKEYEKTGKQPK